MSSPNRTNTVVQGRCDQEDERKLLYLQEGRGEERPWNVSKWEGKGANYYWVTKGKEGSEAAST